MRYVMPTIRVAVIAMLCCFSALAAAAQAPDLVGLYLTWRGDPATTMTINWVDHYGDSGDVVWYRAAESDKWMSAEAAHTSVGPSTLQLRRVELTQLEPGTVYEFGLQGRAKRMTRLPKTWRFRTMPTAMDRPIRFVAGGDMMHTRAMVDAMNLRAAAADPDFALLGGDLAYANGVSAARWIHWLESWMQHAVAPDGRLIPMVVAIGNHEVRGGYNGKIPDDAPYFYSLFSLPGDRSYYALDFGDYLTLVVLDSQHTQPVAGPQAAWLEQALSQRAERKFVFACYHYPAYGTTKAPAGGLPIDAPLAASIREHWVPHFERYGLSAVFENDHHNYKRTHRIRQHQRDDANGILYLGDGAWGVETRTVPLPEAAWWLAQAEPRRHLFTVELRPDGTATIQAVDAEGEVFDQVELTESRTRPVP